MNTNNILDFDATIGTSYQGNITATYQSLCNTFGQPQQLQSDSSDCKVRAEWIMQTPHGIATIYDWKEYNTPLQDVTQWHIGGFNKEVVEYINQEWFNVNTPF